MGSVHGCTGEALEKRYVQAGGLLIGPRVQLVLVTCHCEYRALMTRVKDRRRDYREWYKALGLSGLSCLVYQESRPVDTGLRWLVFWVYDAD